MKAIILNAGRGTRLKYFTQNSHKCLLEINEERIIDRQLNMFKKFDISKIFIVVGHNHEVVESSINNKNVEFIINKEYQETDNSYSLSLIEPFIEDNEKYLIIDGDVIIDEPTFGKFIEQTSDNIAIGIVRPNNSPEDAKIDYVGNYIVQISKKIRSDIIYSSILCLDSDSFRILLEECRKPENRKTWYSQPLNSCILNNLFRVELYKTNTPYWVEIDDVFDLQYAELVWCIEKTS